MKHLLSFVQAPPEWTDLCLRSAFPYPDAMFMHAREEKVYKSRINRDEIAPATYRKLFRFNKEHVEWLAETFLPESDETRGGCLSQVGRMETTLHYLADPGYQTTVAEVMGVTQPTVSRYVAGTLIVNISCL